MGDWISYALARHIDAEELCNWHKTFYKKCEGQNVPVKVRFTLAEDDETEISTEVARQTAEDTEGFDSGFMEKLGNQYESEKGIPVKMSVSEAKRRQNEDEFYSPHIFTVPMISSSDILMLSPTDKGTITHFVLQHIDFSKTGSENEIGNEISEMVEKGIISRVQADTVDTAMIFGFFNSEIGKRLKKAKEIRKEFSFYSEADAGDFYPEQRGRNRKILLQGTMDCFFVEENGKIVLLDYKTDVVSENTLKDRAKKYYYQLSAYKNGLEAVMNRKVDEAYICFLACGKNISIDEIEKTCAD